MTTRIYLKSDAVKSVEFHHVGERSVLEGIKVRKDEAGRLYASPNSFGSKCAVAEELKAHTEEVTHQSVFDSPVRRTCGKYAHGTATMFLDRESVQQYKLGGYATVFEDLFDLYQKIRAGTILPVESWEAEQKPAA